MCNVIPVESFSYKPVKLLHVRARHRGVPIEPEVDDEADRNYTLVYYPHSFAVLT